VKILNDSNKCLVGVLALGLFIVWGTYGPKVISGERLVGGCNCCITAKTKWCGGTFCVSGCGVCKNGTGVRLCVDKGKKCTSYVCEGPCQDYHCDDEQLCKAYNVWQQLLASNFCISLRYSYR